MLKNVLFVLYALWWPGVLQAQQAQPCPGLLIESASICSQACLICSLSGLTGQTERRPRVLFRGSVERWTTAAGTALLRSILVSIKPSKCVQGDGIEAADHEDCQQPPLSCVGGAAGGGSTERLLGASTLVLGRIYCLLVDGYNGDKCHFTITTTPEDAVLAPVPGTVSAIASPTVVPAGAALRYVTSPVPGAGAYRWSSTGGMRINGALSPVVLPASEGTSVEVTFGSHRGQLCVTPLNACSEGASTCMDFRVVPIGKSLDPSCPKSTFPAPDFCGDVCIYCDLSTFNGSSLGYPALMGTGLFCGTIENDQWLGSIAGDTIVQSTLEPSDCLSGDGMQMALYRAGCGAQEQPLACEASGKGRGNHLQHYCKGYTRPVVLLEDRRLCG